MKNLNISDLITHKLASPIHALKFYSEENSVRGDDLKAPVEILENILNKSRLIYSVLKLPCMTWNQFFDYLINCSFFLSPSGENLLTLDCESNDVIKDFSVLNNIFLNFLNFAKYNDLKISLTFNNNENQFFLNFSKEINLNLDLSGYEDFIYLFFNDNDGLKAISIDKTKFTESK